MTNFYKILFSSSLIIGTLISVSANSWFMAWLGLEINLLSLMPLMKSFKNKLSAEASLKYFITQALASAILIFSIILTSNFKFSSVFEISLISSPLLSSALLMKMGAAPLHFWLPEVVSGISWLMNMIILTWQKIAPMILLFYSLNSTIFLSIFIIISALIGSLEGLNQTCLRKLMVFSSINHISWMLSALLSSLNSWFLYFSIYSFMNINIIYLLNLNKVYFMSQINKTHPEKSIKFFLFMNFLSLGGLPPFIGFFIKWITLNEMILNNFFFLATILIVLTLIALYFYLRITFNTLMLSVSENPNIMYTKLSFTSILGSFIPLSSLTLLISFSNLI
uniref:NADH-ubiquinone oxidoreductase chain 2 n=1 Tax=Ips calligraphus TaxID=102827 RepID=A0A8B0KGN8_9CUCU|nr:NADH dehydrogenase subunit 2 [Ips calligraphus]QTV76816.1 NADH dehydrogenase subunit 2 [Ips calligraphus]